MNGAICASPPSVLPIDVRQPTTRLPRRLPGFPYPLQGRLGGRVDPGISLHLCTEAYSCLVRLIQVLSPVQHLAPLRTHQPEKARLAGQFCAFSTFDRDHASAQHPIILVTTIVEKGIDQSVQIGQIVQRQACFGQHHSPLPSAVVKAVWLLSSPSRQHLAMPANVLSIPGVQGSSEPDTEPGPVRAGWSWSAKAGNKTVPVRPPAVSMASAKRCLPSTLGNCPGHRPLDQSTTPAAPANPDCGAATSAEPRRPRYGDTRRCQTGRFAMPTRAGPMPTPNTTAARHSITTAPAVADPQATA